MLGFRAGARPRRRALSSNSTACAPMPELTAGVWRRSTSFATTATAAPAAGVLACLASATPRRPGLDRRRDAAAGPRLDCILITAPDRLARNYVHQVLLVEELQGHGAEVEFLDRPMSQDPHDQRLLQIRGAVAEYERPLINERMRRGRLRKLRAGTLLPWTQPPYGYRLDPERPGDPAGVRLDEAEAAVVRDLFAWFVDEGVSVFTLAQRLQ